MCRLEARRKPAALFPHCSAPCSALPRGTSELSRAQHIFLLSVSASLSGSSTSITWRGMWGPLCAWRAARRVPGAPAPRPAPWQKQRGPCVGSQHSQGSCRAGGSAPPSTAQLEQQSVPQGTGDPLLCCHLLLLPLSILLPPAIRWQGKRGHAWGTERPVQRSFHQPSPSEPRAPTPLLPCHAGLLPQLLPPVPMPRAQGAACLAASALSATTQPGLHCPWHRPGSRRVSSQHQWDFDHPETCWMLRNLSCCFGEHLEGDDSAVTLNRSPLPRTSETIQRPSSGCQCFPIPTARPKASQLPHASHPLRQGFSCSCCS